LLRDAGPGQLLGCHLRSLGSRLLVRELRRARGLSVRDGLLRFLRRPGCRVSTFLPGGCAAAVSPRHRLPTALLYIAWFRVWHLCGHPSPQLDLRVVMTAAWGLLVAVAACAQSP